MRMQVLMGNPEPSSPQDAEVANQYTSDYELWKKTARYWSDLYAKGTVSCRDVAHRHVP
jgi:ubiquitin-conjugating enzyme (huntingtin interacting protein 2)